MADFIPFANTTSSLRLARNHFSEFPLLHLPAHLLPEPNDLVDADKLWIDPGVDGVTKAVGNSDWRNFLEAFQGAKQLFSAEFQKSPAKATVKTFVSAVLDRCDRFKPAWITVPQVLQGKAATQNKINRLLAAAAGEWKRSSGTAARLVLPLLFTGHVQYRGVPDRRRRVDELNKNYSAADAAGVWIVDAGMDDRGPAVMKRRYEDLIALHEQVRSKLEPVLHVAGPYWGINLVLWARGLITHPAVNMGSGCQYYPPGVHPPGRGKTRLPLPPLRRRALTVHLKPWLEHAIAKLGAAHPASESFKTVINLVNSTPDRAREEIVKFYRRWYDLIDASPPEGRAMALFQDLSAAFALGKKLADLPGGEGPIREPHAIAEPLMLNCL